MRAMVLAAILFVSETPPIPIEVHAGTQADPELLYYSDTVAFSWDDSSGLPLVRIDIQVLTTSLEPVSCWTKELSLSQAASRYWAPIRNIADKLPNGVYGFRVRAHYATGDQSEWGAPFWMRKDWRALKQPKPHRMVP